MRSFIINSDKLTSKLFQIFKGEKITVAYTNVHDIDVNAS